MNTPAQHTPGPWHTNGGNIYAQRNPGGIRTSICEVFRDAGYDACRANARLIAAAPELIHACELAYAELRKMGCDCENMPMHCPVCALKAAIEKARGQ